VTPGGDRKMAVYRTYVLVGRRRRPVFVPQKKRRGTNAAPVQPFEFRISDLGFRLAMVIVGGVVNVRGGGFQAGWIPLAARWSTRHGPRQRICSDPSYGNSIEYLFSFVKRQNLPQIL
jgi:hypothetical protein